MTTGTGSQPLPDGRAGTTPLALQSDALKANLQETAQQVVIPPEYHALVEMVAPMRGVATTLQELMYEISHDYRNWNLILPNLRSFLLKNIGHFLRHQQAETALDLFFSILFSALQDAGKKEKLAARTMETILAVADKVLHLADPSSCGHLLSSMNRVWIRLADLLATEPEPALLLVRNQHSLKGLMELFFSLVEKNGDLERFPAAVGLMKKYLALTYRSWLEEEDPLQWLRNKCAQAKCLTVPDAFFAGISHAGITELAEKIEAFPVDAVNSRVRQLLLLPDHLAFVRKYKEIAIGTIPGTALSDKESALEQDNFQLLFLFFIMETKGLQLIHEECLREINRRLSHLIRGQTYAEIKGFLLTTFQLLKANVTKYPHTSLQCIQAIGIEVFRRGNSELAEAFLWETVRFGFQYPNFSGMDEDWQPIANPSHLANIRFWLSLIMEEPKWCATLFSALIINIKLCGTCVKDTDLFQRDITRLLNHPVEPVYNLVKQFSKLMPVFYNEIGAEGRLRDVSTELDEIHQRGDCLIHFLRKQSHVESSNVIVEFIRTIFRFWETGAKQHLSSYLPAEILADVKEKGRFIDEQKRIMKHLRRAFGADCISALLTRDLNELAGFIAGLKNINPSERQRFLLLVEMFRLVHQKYNLSLQEVGLELSEAMETGFDTIAGLKEALAQGDTIISLNALLDCLEELKKTILSRQTFPPKEDIYFKRHIAVDIPSVYGRYREKKFDALGFTFRLENFANTLFENLPSEIDLSVITRASILRIVQCLKLYRRALEIDGITGRRLETYLGLLEESTRMEKFSYTQYIDIFRGLSEGIQDIIYTYYTNIHQDNLAIILARIEQETLLPRYRSLWKETEQAATVVSLSEAFFRDLFAETFGLQSLDLFLTRILNTLEKQNNILQGDDLTLLMSYNPELAICPLFAPDTVNSTLIHLGNKGLNLLQLIKCGIQVPPAFVITTEIFRCRRILHKLPKARFRFFQQVRHALSGLEKAAGKKYGDPSRLLLVSVRSGAPISMPGMMATVHNVGLNRDLTEEFATSSGKPFLAWDNLRRFYQSWGMTKGLPRELFQQVMSKAKEKHHISEKRNFTAKQMKRIALSYENVLKQHKISVPYDPWEQLTEAIELVLNSWETHKTREYRDIIGISDSWGTAVIVQQMVFGNRGEEAGSGVVFTANPYRKLRRVALWGDYATNDQGEDIVSGLVTSAPISVEQAEIDKRDPDSTLERRFPEVYGALLSACRELVYNKEWSPQEIEFTFDGPRAHNLYFLQSRDMITIRKKERFQVFSPSAALEKNLLTHGIGVNGSALSGRAAFDESDLKLLQEKHPGVPRILIRQDTVPEDIKIINMADGLLTSRGGQTSHASVVATRLGKTCVVGCRSMQVSETRHSAVIDATTITTGDWISIDGRNGSLFTGAHPVQNEVHILPI